MRIARVLTRLNLGGPARQALASDPALTERGHQVRVFAGTPTAGEGDLFDAFSDRGIDVVRVPGLGRGIGPGDWRAAGFLRRAFAEFEPDLVHTHASKAGTLGRRAAWRQGGVPTVHTFHGHVLEGYFSPTASRLLVRHERRMAARTDRIVAVSHATADDLVRLEVAAEDALTVIPPGIDLDDLLAISARRGALRESVGATADDFVIGVVGRLAEVKRPRLAVQVFELLAERYPRLHLCFIGDGDQRRSLTQCIRRGGDSVRARVHLIGATPDMVAALADLDAVLLTSRSEGMPVALIEAAAAGLPVVATAVGGVGELVAHERTGWLGTSVDELAFGLAQLLDSPSLAADMGQRARVRVRERHSAAALADRLDALYEAVIEEAPCAC